MNIHLNLQLESLPVGKSDLGCVVPGLPRQSSKSPGHIVRKLARAGAIVPGLAICFFLSACHPRAGTTVAGVVDVSAGEQVMFQPSNPDSAPIPLPPALGDRFIALVRSDARYDDRRGLTSASWGSFKVKRKLFYLHGKFLCDDQNLRGRFWDSQWIGDAMEEKIKATGFLGSRGEWVRLFGQLSLTGGVSTASKIVEADKEQLATALLDSVQVIRIAEKVALNQSRDLGSFNQPVAKFYPGTKSWMVFFDGKERLPGNTFSVIIDDLTQAAELRPGD